MVCTPFPSSLGTVPARTGVRLKAEVVVFSQHPELVTADSVKSPGCRLLTQQRRAQGEGTGQVLSLIKSGPVSSVW